MSEWTFDLERRHGMTAVNLYDVPLRWLAVEHVAAALIGRRFTDGLANWLFDQAERRHVLLETFYISDKTADAIDPDWNRIWSAEPGEQR